MSSFQLNLSSLTLGAKERLARLEAAGGIKSLLSPPSASAPAVGSGSSASPPSATDASSPGQRVSIERLAAAGLGGSGESFVAGGFSGSLLSIFVTSPESLESMCCGAVAGGVKFCTLRAQECSFTTHVKKVEVRVNALYISTGRNSGFSHHCVAVADVDQGHLSDLLRELHPKDVWIRLFRGVNQAKGMGEGMAGGRSQHVSILDAVTPGRKRKARYEDPLLGEALFATPGKRDPSLARNASFEEELVILPSIDSEDQTPEERMMYVVSQWNQMVSTINKLGGNITTIRGFMAEDVSDLDARVLEVDSRVGNLPGKGGFEECGTVCDALAYLLSAQTDLKAHIDGDRIARVTEADAREAATNLRLQTLHEELDTKLNKSLIEIQAAFDGIGDTLKLLSLEQERLTEQVLLRPTTMPTSPINPSSEIAQLTARLKAVEARLPSNPSGRLGGEAFQSRMDVQVFVETHVPSNCFYLFHDVVTLMESLTTSHVERKDVLQEWYQSVKVGINEASARHMASFRLVLPTVFGRTKEGTVTSSKHHLPSVKSFKDWNTFDGVSGVKGYIAAGMEDLKYQFRQDIEHTLDLVQHSRARLLAMEMHEGAQNFVMEMSSWIDAFYQELVTTSQATEEEAWEVVGACVRKMFEVLRVPRAQAANATMDPDPVSQCATYLWALVQSHKIMREFLEARFRNHGAIAPVIVLHIFKTRVTRVAVASSIKRLEGRIAALEKSKDSKGN